MERSVKRVGHDHGAVWTHLAAIEAQRVATDLPYTHLVWRGIKGTGLRGAVIPERKHELTSDTR